MEEPTPVYEEYPDMRHATQSEEFEEWERQEVLRREKESNDVVKALREKDGRVYPSYQEQDSNFLNDPNY